MDDVRQRIANLSPEKRALLELRLMQQRTAHTPMETIPRRDSTAPCALSFAQQRLWFLAQMEPESPHYNEPKVVRLRGALDIGLLQQALDAVVARHETLRTTFVAVDGTPMQVVAEKQCIALPVLDLRAWPEATREAEMQRQLVEAIRHPFNLTRDVLLRALVVHLRDEEHLLLLVMHHIASDGWSTRVLLREIDAFYTAFATGNPVVLPELPIQYADYALWQQQWLQGKRLEDHLAYWKQQLAGAPTLLELPTDHPHPAIQTWRGTRQVWVFPTSLASDLAHVSRQAGVTLFMTLLAAFQTLLYRYTGQEDMVVGAPIAGRTRKETEHLIGFFVNALVLRTHFAGNPTFRELLGRVREVTLGAYAHQELPFEKLVEELQPERSLSHTPLVQVMFAFQNVPRSPVTLHALAVQELEVQRTIAKFDLTLVMWETEGTLRAEWEYNTDLFEDATITRLAGHFQILLESIVADPDQAVTTVPLLTEAERQQRLVTWNATQTAYPREACIHELVAAQAARTPEAVAVVDGERQLTYGELNHRANQVAHTLQALGVGPDVLVGICMERSADMVVGLLGILKAGGAYVPFDPTYPCERLQWMIEDCQPAVLLTHRRQRDAIQPSSAPVVCLDLLWDQVPPARTDNPQSATAAEHLAYVMYTSGSTGMPKGVAVPHRAVTRLVCNTNYIYLEPTDVVAQVANCAFDAATFEIWGALVHGARLVVLTTDIVLASHTFAAHLKQQGITVMFLTTALFNQLAHDVPTAFGQMRTLLVGGEALEPHWIAEVLRQAPPERLLNVYGPTETTTFATWYQIEDVAPGQTSIPIGRPIANTELYVLDAHLQPVPVGIPGELYIGGDGVARGYLRRPELTAERFIEHPFSQAPGARLYKTGDLVRYLPDGNIAFLGRTDFQVKLRGFRIELGEVEAVLSQHPGVREVVVLAREDTPGEKRLVAYLVDEPTLLSTANALRNFAQTKLPAYMVPAAFVCLDTMPLTPNGKVNRRALPAPDRTSCEVIQTYVAPHDHLERQIVAAWEQVLGTQPIGVHDNFFALGGHSLLAVRLCARLEHVCRTAVSLALLFQAPTVAQLADLLRQADASTPPLRLLAHRPGGSKPPFFCVHGVGRLAHYLDTEQPFYTLHPYALDGRRAPDTIEAMATDYLRDIRTVQPEGPYFLGGGSIGGMIAFEMAQQLRRQGQTVALLVLIDPTRPGNDIGTLGGMMRRIKRITRKIAARAVAFSLTRGYRVPLRLRMPYFIEVSLRAASAYTPQCYPGSIVLFQTAQRDGDLQQAWEKFVAGVVESYEVPGNHFTMLQEPHIQVLAERLALCLHQTHVGGAPTTALPSQVL